MKKNIGILLLAVLMCFIVVADSGCKSKGYKPKSSKCRTCPNNF